MGFGWILVDFGGFGPKKVAGRARGAQKVAWEGPGDLQGAQNVKMCCFLVPFWDPFGAQIGPKTAQGRFQNC